MKLFILFFTVAITTVLSQEITVTPLNSDFEADKLESKNVKVKQHKVKPLRSTMPKISERNDILKAAGLENLMSKMDELDKDMLFMKAKRYGLADLKKSYPDIEAEKLERLQTLAQGGK